ncbi:Integrase catalytic domain-containing protein, partial [Aphis craccivora]
KWDSRIRYHKVDYVSERVVRSVSNTWIITDVIKRTSSGTSVASSGETSRIRGSKDQQQQIKALTYNQLTALVEDLRIRLRNAEQTTGQTRSDASVNATDSTRCNEIRMFTNLDHSVKVFSGNESNYDAADWLQSVGNVADLNAWPVAYRMQFVRANVTEAARDWFLYRTFADWDDFVKQFRTTFVRKMLISDCWDALKERKQGKDEPVMKYFQEKVRWCRELSLGVSETRDYVIRGLYKWELAQYALGREHRNLDELLNDLLDWTRMFTVRGEQTRYMKTNKDMKKNLEPRNNNRWPKLSVEAGAAAMETADTNRKSTEYDSSCWKCNKEGHISKDCPVRRKSVVTCYTCQGEGHFSRQCPKRRTTNLVTERKEIDIHPYVKFGTINGLEVKVLIDTGSHYSLIRTSMAKKCGLPITKINTDLCGIGDVNNPAVKVSGEIVSTIVIDEVEAGPVRLLIVPDDAQGSEVIVGRNWLDDPAVVYWKEDGQMKLAKSENRVGVGDTTATSVDEHLDVLQVIALEGGGYRRSLTMKDFKYVNTDVTLQEQQLLMDLVNEYRDCFALNINELGCTGLTEMELHEVEGSVPVVCRPQEEKVLMAQTNDVDIREIIEILNKPANERTKSDKSRAQGFELHGQLLYRIYNGKELFVMPKSMRKSITVGAHDLCGHLSVEKTVKQILQDNWFTGMRRYVKRHVSMCIECLMTKRPRGRQPGLLHPIPVGRRPFDIIHMDHIGPFLTTTTGNKYILVIVDNLTKFTCLFAAKDTSADGAIVGLIVLVQMFGLPNRIVTDRGTCFTARKFEEYCEENGIQHTLNSTRRPQANGQVERTNSVVLSMLLTQVTSEDEWDKWLPDVQRQINNSESKVTQRTPFELLHGYRPRFGLGRTRVLSRTVDVWTCPDELWEEAREASEESKARMKDNYDLHRHDNTKYVVGEIVVMTTVPTHTGQSTKLQNKYKGPLTVTEVLPGDIYRVAQLQEDQKRLYTTTAHVSQLKSWKLEEELDETMSNEGDEGQGPINTTSSEEENGEMLPVQTDNNAEVRKSFRARREPYKLVDYVH